MKEEDNKTLIFVFNCSYSLSWPFDYDHDEPMGSLKKVKILTSTCHQPDVLVIAPLKVQKELTLKSHEKYACGNIY